MRPARYRLVMDDEELRKVAHKRLQAKQGFIYFLFVWLGVSIIVTLVWLLSGGGYFWPGWVIGGMGIAAFFSGLNAYGPPSNVIPESKIDAEVRKLKGQ
jgi:hypothetical protein